MKKFNTVIIEKEEGFEPCEFEIFACELTSFEVEEAEKEYALYMKKQGKFYDMDSYKEPSVKNFFNLYFGDEEVDYYGEFYNTPSRYIFPDEDTAKRFFKLAKKLEYHNRYKQTYCDVTQDGIFVDIEYGEY